MALPERPRAVITGAGSGLGRALALALAARRARLLLSDIDEPALAAVAQEAGLAGAEVATSRTDVGKLEEMEQLASLADARFGGVDLLVNNAGVAVAGRLGEVPIEDWRWQLDVNLWGVIHGVHVFAPKMAARGSGAILNVASAAAFVSVPELGAYNVTKAAVLALTTTLRAELAGTGVTVTALCPSFFASGIHTRARASARAAAIAARLIGDARWSADDIARAALRGVDRGRLYVVPQPEARLGWALACVVPRALVALLGLFYRRRWFDRLGSGA